MRGGSGCTCGSPGPRGALETREGRPAARGPLDCVPPDSVWSCPRRCLFLLCLPCPMCLGACSYLWEMSCTAGRCLWEGPSGGCLQGEDLAGVR
jgi:hypothetical protein